MARKAKTVADHLTRLNAAIVEEVGEYAFVGCLVTERDGQYRFEVTKPFVRLLCSSVTPNDILEAILLFADGVKVAAGQLTPRMLVVGDEAYLHKVSYTFIVGPDLDYDVGEALTRAAKSKAEIDIGNGKRSGKFVAWDATGVEYFCSWEIVKETP